MSCCGCVRGSVDDFRTATCLLSPEHAMASNRGGEVSVERMGELAACLYPVTTKKASVF